METSEEHERAANALGSHASLLHALLGESADMITVSDRRGRIVYASPATERVSGYSVEEFMRAHPFESIHPDDRLRCEAAFAQLLKTPGLRLDLQHRIRHKHGEWRWVEGVFTSMFDDPTVNGLVSIIRDVTLRVQTEAALRESEARFRALVTASSDVLYRMSADWGEMINLKGMDFIADTEEPRRDWLAAYIPQEEQSRVMDVIQAAIRAKSVFELEHRVIRVDGTQGWTFSRAVPLLNAQNEITEWFGTASDITERKQIEQALHESEERMQKALSIRTVSVIFFDLDGRIYDGNEAFQQMSGYSREDLQSGRVRWDEVTPPQFMPATLIARQELLTKGENTPYEKQYIRKDGSRWWGLFAGKRLNERECVEFIIDITERKQTEAIIRESEQRFRSVADLVPDLLWSNDSGGWVDWYNQRWINFTGQTLEESQGFGWLDAIHPDDRETALRNFQAAIDSGEPLRQEYRIRSRDGAYRWFLVHAGPVRDDSGQIVRWYGAATDMHKERMALAAEQASRAETEAALKTREMFLSIASHELRTPLTALLGYAHILGKSRVQDQPNIVRITGMIVRQAQRLDALIGQLLDIARLQQGQFILDRQPIDVAGLIAQTVDDFRTTLPPDAGHLIELACPSETIMVAADAPRLEQAVQNLLSNAVKYSPQGGVVRIRVVPAAAEVTVEVEDEGIGIPASARDQLFEPFFRAGNVQPNISGFGVGLHIVREIVQRHGGRIEVESAEGVGSTFQMVLPMLDPAQD